MHRFKHWIWGSRLRDCTYITVWCQHVQLSSQREISISSSISEWHILFSRPRTSVCPSFDLKKSNVFAKWLRCLFSSVYLVFRTKLHCQQNLWKRWLERQRREEADATQWIGLVLFALSDFVAKCCRGVKDGVEARLMHRLLFSTPSKCYRCQHAESSQLSTCRGSLQFQLVWNELWLNSAMSTFHADLCEAVHVSLLSTLYSRSHFWLRFDSVPPPDRSIICLRRSS